MCIRDRYTSTVWTNGSVSCELSNSHGVGRSDMPQSCDILLYELTGRPGLLRIRTIGWASFQVTLQIRHFCYCAWTRSIDTRFQPLPSASDFFGDHILHSLDLIQSTNVATILATIWIFIFIPQMTSLNIQGLSCLYQNHPSHQFHWNPRHLDHLHLEDHHHLSNCVRCCDY